MSPSDHPFLRLAPVLLVACGIFLALRVSAISSGPQVYQAIQHEVSPVLRPVRAIHRSPVYFPENGSGLFRWTSTVASSPGAEVQLSTERLQGTTIGNNFDGVAYDGRLVPDTNGAVGATQYVQWVNVDFAVYDKSTLQVLRGPSDATTLWTGFSPCDTPAAQGGDGDDVIVQYDKLAQRWVMTQHFAPSGGPYYQCVAVSTTSDATGTFNVYQFPLPPNYFPDYPKLAVWPDGYYLTMNEEDPNTFALQGPLVCALDRASMISGTAARSPQCFQLSSAYSSLLPSDLDGTIAPPAGSPNYLLSLAPNSLLLWKFHVDWTTPANSTLTGPTSIPVAAFTKACKGSGLCVPQSGTTQLLDGIGDRLMYRLAYRHFADGHESLVASHSVNTPSGVRWYELQNLNGNPVVFQQGTFAPDPNYRWMPSIAMDQMGDIAVGYSVSSSSMFPAIRYTGRLQSDPMSTLETEASIIEGGAAQVSSNRWGDYTAMAIDPVDDCTFWYTNEYFPLNATNWHTRIASFSFPSCSNNPPATVAPNSLVFGPQTLGTTSAAQAVTLTNNQNTTLTINSISANGSFAERDNCNGSLAPLSSCTILVTFTPSTTGTATGQMVVNDTAPFTPQVVNMIGTGGVPQVALAHSSLTFRSFPGTTSPTLTDRVTNTGTGPLIISAVTASGDYGVKSNCLSGSPIAPGNFCTLYITFAPTITGSIPGTITIADNGANAPPHLVSLSGTGLTTLAVSPSSVTYSTVPVGSTSPPKTATIKNNTNTAQTFTYSVSRNFNVVPGGASPCGTNPATLAAGSSCTVEVTFSPTSNGTGGTIKGALTVTDSASVPYNPQVVSLSGTASGGSPEPLSFSPTQLQLGNAVLGVATNPQTIIMTNVSGATLTLSSLTASGDFAANPSGATPCSNGQTLAANASCTFTVSLTATTAGSISGGVTVVDTATSGPTTQVYNLSAMGTWPLKFSPAALTFPPQATGTTSSPQTVTVTNYSAAAITINGVIASGDFNVIPGSTNQCGHGVILATLANCTFAVTFTPAAPGAINGAVTLTHSATTSPQVVPLSGTGN